MVEGLLDALVPAYCLESSPDGAHRIGGEPELTDGDAWPVNERGVELTFIAVALNTILRAPVADLYDHPFEVNALTALVAEPSAARTRARTPTRPPSVEDTDDDPQLLGPPESVREDPRYGGPFARSDESLRALDAWMLLLQLDNSFARYGDGGGFFVVIPRADLAAGRYDRGVTESQCH
jgi:hypothetical protein